MIFENENVDLISAVFPLILIQFISDKFNNLSLHSIKIFLKNKFDVNFKNDK